MFTLLAEAIDIYLMLVALLAGELTRKVLDVNARASVNMGWIFIGQKGNSHGFISYEGVRNLTDVAVLNGASLAGLRRSPE